MAVHAHPDDEASGGGILATYADQGIRVVVVTCTNGEYGDAPGGIKPGQPGHDPEAVARLRLAELEESARILKISDVEMLGYHDSGMPDWEYKDRPEAFSNVPLEEVAGRIGGLITKYRPQVLVTYDDQGAYQHPDHVHASRAAQAAAAETGIPAKLYLSTMRSSSWRKIWEALRAAGADLPARGEDEELASRVDDDRGQAVIGGAAGHSVRPSVECWVTAIDAGLIYRDAPSSNRVVAPVFMWPARSAPQ